MYSTTRTFQTPLKVALIMIHIRRRFQVIDRLSQPVGEF